MMPPASPSPGPVAAYLDSLSPSSRPAMRDSLGLAAKFFGSTVDALEWHELRYAQAQALRTHLASRYKSRTVNKALAGFRGVLKAAWRMGLMSTDDFHHARDVKVVKISEPMAGRMLAPDELKRLTAPAGADLLDLRNAALAALMYGAGLRKHEVRLRAKAYDRETGVVTIRGKRNKVRLVPLHARCRPVLEAWLDRVERQPEEWIFAGRKAGKPLSLTGVVAALEAQREAAGVAPFTSHDLRRTLLTNLLDSGADIALVARIAGHEDVNTTAGYDRRGEAAKAAAIGRLKGFDE